MQTQYGLLTFTLALSCAVGLSACAKKNAASNGGSASDTTSRGDTAAASTDSGAQPTEEVSAPTDAPISAPPQTGLLALFDAHAHLMPTWPEDTLANLLADHEPDHIVLLGVTNVLSEQETYPVQVIAFSNFKEVDNINLNKLKSELEQGARGIGEVSIRHFAAGPPPAEADEHDFNAPELLAVYDLARAYQVPVNFHFDYHPDHVGEILSTMPDYADVTFIWAHAGDAQPEDLMPLLDLLPNLYLDISCRNPLKSFEGRLLSLEEQRLDEADGTLKAAWRTLFETYSDRVMYGSDIGPNGRLEQYAEIQDYYRTILAQLSPDIAEQIAHKNAQSIFPDPGQ